MRDLPPRSSRPHNAIPSPLVISTGHRDIFSLCHLDRSRSACDDAVERSRGWRQNHADLGSFLEASFVALSSQRTRGHQLVEPWRPLQQEPAATGARYRIQKKCSQAVCREATKEETKGSRRPRASSPMQRSLRMLPEDLHLKRFGAKRQKN